MFASRASFPIMVVIRTNNLGGEREKKKRRHTNTQIFTSIRAPLSNSPSAKDIDRCKAPSALPAMIRYRLSIRVLVQIQYLRSTVLTVVRYSLFHHRHIYKDKAPHLCCNTGRDFNPFCALLHVQPSWGLDSFSCLNHY